MKVTRFGHCVLNIEDMWSIECPSEDFAGTSVYATLRLASSPEELSHPLLGSIDICDRGSSLWEIVVDSTSTEDYDENDICCRHVHRSG